MPSEHEREPAARTAAEEEITATRERLSAALYGNEALLHTLNLHSNVSVMDSRGFIIDVNENFCRISGYSREELLGQSHSVLYSGTPDDELWTERWRTITSGESWRGEISNRTKGGALLWMDSMIAPILGEDGRPALYISIRNDITAAKETELKLRATDVFLDRTGQTAGVGGWEYDVRTQVLRWSAQMMRLHRVELSYQPVLKEVLKFYPSEARAKLKAALRKGIKHGTAWDMELPLVTQAGNTIWVRMVGEAEFIRDRPVRLVGSMQDITARKQIETSLALERARMATLVVQLQEANSRFAIASESAGIAIWEFDAMSRKLVWDDRMHALYGIERSSDMTFKQWEDALHPEDRARCVAEVELALLQKTDFNTEFRIVRPSGEIRYVRATARVLIDADAGVLRMTGVNIDISDSKQSQLQLFKTSSMLRTVLDSAAEVSIIATAPDLTVKVFNAGAERLLGYTSGQVVDRCTPVLVHDQDELRQLSGKVGGKLGQNLTGWEVFVQPSMRDQPHECTFVHQDGRRLKVSQVVTAMHSYEGELLGYLSVAHDVTLQRQYEQSLREATDRAEHANQAKSDFLANMSHEIRTPMNAVIGLSYLLARTSLDNEQSVWLANLQTSSKSLLAILNDVLDLSKIEAGELLVEKTSFCPRAVLQEVADVMRLHANDKGITFRLQMPADLPLLLVGDPTRLGQILTNLLSNAIRFTDRGTVDLSVTTADLPDNEVKLCIIVKDTGIGISQDAQNRIFSPFAQADASITRRYGGTGLGLSIVRSLVKVLGGALRLDSTPGVGSEFTVELTFSRASTPAPEVDVRLGAAGTTRLSGVRVLVADDSDMNLSVVKSILELEGAQVSLARNGQEAFDRLQVDASEFDVVLMDIQMPIMGGHAATSLIRAELGLVDLPIIALTAGALSSERDRAIAAGVDDFLIKPFEPTELVLCISKNVGVSNLRAATPISATPIAPDPAAAQWPEIEGIDSADARQRLSNDARLFLSSLARLLIEFSESSLTFDDKELTDLPLLAQRMHKLKGMSGMLGAKDIYALALEAEAACLAGDPQAASGFATALARRIQRLRESAAPVISAARTQTDPAADPTEALFEPHLVRELVHLLRQQNLSAVDRFRSLEPHLRSHMAAEDQLMLRGHVDALQFHAAAEILDSKCTL